MQEWLYTGHQTTKGRLSGQLQNPYCFVTIGGVEYVKMGLMNSKSFIFDKEDLSIVMNFDESIALSKSSIMIPKYENLVPTWSSKPNGSIYCSSWPQFSSKQFAKKSIGLAILLVGSRGQKMTVCYNNGNNQDLRRKNLRYKDHVEYVVEEAKTYRGRPLIKPEIKQSTIQKAVDNAEKWTLFPMRFVTPLPALTDFQIIQSFPGYWHPDLNPYMLVEYEGKRFYRMKTANGFEFFFSENDLEKVQKVPCLMGGRMAWIDHPIWYIPSTKKLSTTDRIIKHVVCSPLGCAVLSLHRWVSGEGSLEEQRMPSLTVQHLNGNAWDNRQENLKTFIKN